MSKFIFLMTLLTLIFFGFYQNCSDVSLERKKESSGNPTAAAMGGLTFINHNDSDIKAYRGVFVVDVSQSMYSGSCPDSIDTMIPGVSPSTNCRGPSGTDPQGHKRWRLIINWLNQLNERIEDQGLDKSQFSFKIIPFSNPLFRRLWEISCTGNIQRLRGRCVNEVMQHAPFSEDFLSIDESIRLAKVFWALETNLRLSTEENNSAFDPSIPVDVIEAIRERSRLPFDVPQNSDPSTGTTIPAFGLEDMNKSLHRELNKIEEAGELSQSHFELILISDGVPKPHPLHIEAAAILVWNTKDIVCDRTLYPFNANCANGYYPVVEGNTGVVRVTGGSNCVRRCEGYLKTYIETGSPTLPPSEIPQCTGYFSVPQRCREYSDGSTSATRWGRDIKCGQCFELLRQYDPSAYSSIGSNRDQFKENIERFWGDWLLNRHSHIFRLIETTSNIFRIQYPGPQWKLNFLRLDSDVLENKVPPGELAPELNWMVAADERYRRSHRFVTITTEVPPFEIFEQLSPFRQFQIGAIYVYNRNYRMDASGQMRVDSDGDGLFDDEEIELGFDPLKARTNGVCLDSIVSRFGGCVQLGCDPQVDRDGDGLNQCEERTLGTNDFDPDSDRDSILDGVELLFNLSVSGNDRKVDSNNNGITNFEQFVQGIHPMVDIRSVPDQFKIQITSELAGFTKAEVNSQEQLLAGYEISVANIPIGRTLWNKDGEPAENEVVLVVRVDNTANPFDSRYLAKVYRVQENSAIEIDLNELKPLNLETP